MQLTSLRSRIEGISDADPPQGENDTDETRLLSDDDGCYEETNEAAMTNLYISNPSVVITNGRDRVQVPPLQEVMATIKEGGGLMEVGVGELGERDEEEEEEEEEEEGEKTLQRDTAFSRTGYALSKKSAIFYKALKNALLDLKLFLW